MRKLITHTKIQQSSKKTQQTGWKLGERCDTCETLTNQSTFFNTLGAVYSLLWQQTGHLKLTAGQFFTFLVQVLISRQLCLWLKIPSAALRSLGTELGINAPQKSLPHCQENMGSIGAPWARQDLQQGKDGVSRHELSSCTSPQAFSSIQNWALNEEEHKILQKKESDFNICIHWPGKRLL